MPTDRLVRVVEAKLAQLDEQGTRKGPETVARGILPAEGGRGPRYLLEGEGDRPFLRMNSNGYLGMALCPEVMAAAEDAVRRFGTGPQAVRFISGTYAPHVQLERALAAFHGREAGMIFSSAYAAMMGVLPPLVTEETAVISDQLNHNCIINAIRLARPKELRVFPHLDVTALENSLERAAESGACRRALVVTDGVFSMRGDHAALDRLSDAVRRFDERFPENAVLVVDDSHGVGAFGETGRGTEEVTGGRADILVATLGKALGVNGGYAVGPASVIDLLREQSPYYVYSNPISPGEAAAAHAALALLDSPVGRERLARLAQLTARFERGLQSQGLETLPGTHPIVPLLVRDTDRTRALVRHLRDHGILATGLSYPVVPRGDEEIRFQLTADHTEADVDEVLQALAAFGDQARVR
jgi:glycine C-acetyltransferase